MNDHFVKFPSIDSFAHVWRQQTRRLDAPRVVYGAKIKLHGTNGGVRVNRDGSVVAQSRTRSISPEMDNAGFAAWVQQHNTEWSTETQIPEGADSVVFFGEWAGNGIQKNDAVTKLDCKYFFVFSIQIGSRKYNDPILIERIAPDLDNLIVLPWHMEFEESLGWEDPAAANAWVELLNEEVERIGACDPFIREIFGVEGVGEGLVLTPVVGDDGLDRDQYSALTFKAKSEAHRVKKSDKAVKKRMEIPEGVIQFVDMFVTDARCEQGLMEACGGTAEKPRTSDFLKWMGSDVKKESKVELEMAGLEWKQVAGLVNRRSAQWYINRCKNPFAGEAE